MKSPRKIAIYVRSATREDGSQDELLRQEVRCRELICRQFPEMVQNPDDIRVYQDVGISGMTMDRPGLQTLLRDMNEHQFDTLFSTDLSRLSRNLSALDSVFKAARNTNTVLMTIENGIFKELAVRS